MSKWAIRIYSLIYKSVFFIFDSSLFIKKYSLYNGGAQKHPHLPQQPNCRTPIGLLNVCPSDKFKSSTCVLNTDDLQL